MRAIATDALSDFLSLSLVLFLFGDLLFASAKKRTLVAEIEEFFRVVFDIVGRMPTVTRWICAGFFQVLMRRRLLLVTRLDWVPFGIFSSSKPAPYSLFLVGDRRPGEEERVLSLWPLPRV